MTAACLVVAVLLSPLLVSVALAGLLCGALCVLVGLVGIALARQAARPAPTPAGADYPVDALPDPVDEHAATATAALTPTVAACGGPAGCLCQADDRDIYRRYAAFVAAQRRVDAERRNRARRWEGRDA